VNNDLINCKGDLYNLRTGEVRPLTTEDGITKSMYCKPGNGDKPPTMFYVFLEKIETKGGE